MKHTQIFSRTLSLFGDKMSCRMTVEVDFLNDSVGAMLDVIRTEADACQRYLEKLFESPRMDKYMRKIIRYLQNLVESVMEACTVRMLQAEQEDELSEEIAEFCTEAQLPMMEVLELIADLFPQFMERDRCMPVLYRDARVAEFRAAYDELLRNPACSPPVSEELNRLKVPLRLTVDDLPEAELSYQEIEHLKSFLFSAGDILKVEPPGEALLQKMHARFWHSNFNCPEYVAVVVERELQPIADLPVEEQIAAMVKVINRIRRRKRITDGGLDSEPPLKDAVMAKLVAHLDGLKLQLSTERFLRCALPLASHSPLIQATIPTEKLGYLLRYLMEHGILSGIEPEVLINFVCTFMQPRYYDHYSYDVVSAAYFTEPVISEHNVKRILETKG
ncbi:hypothetical protein ACWKWU_13550 [Chitinophaga lutea]